jgi:hypothetical protein
MRNHISKYQKNIKVEQECNRKAPSALTGTSPKYDRKS